MDTTTSHPTCRSFILPKVIFDAGTRKKWLRNVSCTRLSLQLPRTCAVDPRHSKREEMAAITLKMPLSCSFTLPYSHGKRWHGPCPQNAPVSNQSSEHLSTMSI